MSKEEKYKIGFLPTYMQLFDENVPQMKKNCEVFTSDISKKLEALFKVIKTPIVKVKADFKKAVELFEKESVDAIITLHLAYSLSGEAAEALSETSLPIIILNTTPDHYFGPGHDPARILYNHGIHGVQDLCNILTRNSKNFFIEAGHWERSDIFERIYLRVIQARMVKTFLNIRVGRIGGSLEGMDDFKVPDKLLEKKYNFKIIQAEASDILGIEKDINDKDVDEEIKHNMDKHKVKISSPDLYRNSIRTGLAIRKWRESNKLNAFVANAFYFSRDIRLPFIPFLEISKALSRGIGYAGEGDILTASFTASLMSSFPDSTFTEMFCPDWQNDAIFLSHAGEVNTDLIEGKPKIIEKPWLFSKGYNPITVVGRLKAGKAVLCSLSPIDSDKFRLIVSDGEMLPVNSEDRFEDVIHGWFKPDIHLEDFLANFSRWGGIHHSVLVYGSGSENVIEFGKMMNWDIVSL